MLRKILFASMFSSTGDVIIETNHKKSTDAGEIYKTIEENSQLTLLVVRGEQKIRFNVTFE